MRRDSPELIEALLRGLVFVAYNDEATEDDTNVISGQLSTIAIAEAFRLEPYVVAGLVTILRRDKDILHVIDNVRALLQHPAPHKWEQDPAPHKWEQGCYVDGTWGQYGLTRLIEVAETAGFPVSDSVRFDMGVDAETNGSDDDYELIVEEADRAEAWLNENIAGSDEAFGWHEGEFFLWPLTTWNEDDIDPDVELKGVKA